MERVRSETFFRRHHAAAQYRFPAPVAGRSGHRDRGGTDAVRGPGADLRAHPELGVCRADGCFRPGATGGVRSVGWRAGRPHGPANAADHYRDRTGRLIGAAVAAGRIVRRQRVGGAVPALGAAGVFCDQLAYPCGGHPADASPGAVAGRQRAQHDGSAVRVHRRTVAGGCAAQMGGSVHAVPDRCDRVRGADLGDRTATQDATDRSIEGPTGQRIRSSGRVGRISVSGRAQDRADVLCGGSRGHDLRDAAHSVSADRARGIR